jgi:hypothetical protein
MSSHPATPTSRPSRLPANLPKEEPAIPLTDQEAKRRAKKVRESIAIIHQIKQRGASIEELEKAVPAFVEQFPMLFKMVTRPGGYDEASLETMIRMLDGMGAARLSQHEASQVVGQTLLDKYVKPQLRAGGDQASNQQENQELR